MDQLSGLCRDANLLAVPNLETDRARLAVGSRNRDLRNVKRRFLAIDPALRVRLRCLAVARVDVDAQHDDFALLGHGADDFTRLALVLAGQDDDRVALADLRRGHGYSTSGARLMIFMCLR